MKIIHCADLHLDSSMTGLLSKEKAKERKNELLLTFKKMIDYAVKEGVLAIIIAGDLFDTKSVSAAARNCVLAAIEDNPDIYFFYLKGNHDSDNFLSSLQTIPENLKLFSDKLTTYHIGEKGNIAISGIELTPANSNSFYSLAGLDMTNFNILVLHGQESQSASKDKAEIINLKELKNKGIDYLALGHIHSYKRDALDGRGKYCYPGCLEGRGFAECGPHGFVVLDIDEDRMLYSAEFIKAASRNLHEVFVDISECLTSNDCIKRAEQTLKEEDIPSSDLVKIVLTGDVDYTCEKDPALIKTHFRDSYYYVKLKDKSGFKVDYDAFKNDKSLKGEFVRTVISSEELTAEEQAGIIRYGIKALMGEVID